MSKKPTLSDVTNILTAGTVINSNNDKIETSFENTLSRDGSTPNNMEADLDMDSNDLLNVGRVDAKEIFLDGTDFTNLVTEAQGYAELAEAWAESETAPDPEDPTSKSAKTWAGEAELNSKQITVEGGTYQRFLSNKLGDVLTVADFGVQYGDDTDQSAAMNSAIAAAVDGAVQVNGNMWRSKHIVDLGHGVIRLDNPLDVIDRPIAIHGRGNASLFNCRGAFDVLTTRAFEDDETTQRFHWGMEFKDFQINSADALNPLTNGIVARSMIRFGIIEGVRGKGLINMFDIDRCWTLLLRDCGHEGANGITINHARIGPNSGAVSFLGGRYDLSIGAGLLINGSNQNEVFLGDDTSWQFGTGPAVEIIGDGVRTIHIKDAFFEGSLINNTTQPYLQLIGSNTIESACEVSGTVINNLAQPARSGTGVAYIDGFQSVKYDGSTRWQRNSVRIAPKFGENIGRAEIKLNTTTPPNTVDMPFLSATSESTASISRPFRPTIHYGPPMSLGTPNFLDKAAGVFGTLSSALVSIGAWAGMPAIQGHGTGTDFNLHLNPSNGNVLLGQSSARVTAGRNEFYGRFKSAAQITSSSPVILSTTETVGVNTSAASRSVNIINIPAETGQTVTVVKLDAANSLVIKDENISPASTRSNINGSTTLVLTELYEAVTIRYMDDEWVVVSHTGAA